MDAMQVGRADWLQVAGHRLDAASYIMSQQGMQGLPVVFFRKGYLAQQQERCMPAELQSLEWQPLSQHAAHVAPVSVAEMEPCVIGVCEYTLMTPEMGRGKRRRGAPTQPLLRLLLVQQGMPGGSDMGVWVEHHVHLSSPDFIITRERFDASTSLPFLYGQRVQMTWKDAADPTSGEWYEGTVSMGEEWGHGPGAIWEGVSVMWDVDRSTTRVSPWELVRLPHQQHYHQQQPGSVPDQHPSMQHGLVTAQAAQPLQGRPSAAHVPHFHTGKTRVEEAGPMIPTVADHPRHLPRLQLRPGVPTAAGKGPTNGMGVGVGVGAGMGYRAASHTSLAEPGSEVSADTPGTLPWGQPGVMSSPNRVLNGGTNAEVQTASQAAALSHPQAGGRLMSPSTHPQTNPTPPLSMGLPQTAHMQEPSAAARENPRALREDSLAALRSRHPQGLGTSGQRPEMGAVKEEDRNPGEVERYQGVTVLQGRAGDHVYMAVLRDGNNAEQTCGAFATALDAAKAHDAEALRVYGPAAEAMLNFPMTNYPNVLAEVQSRRRTNSTDEMDTPASLPDSPWIMDLRSQSLTTIGAPLSPHAQRQLIASGLRQTPASERGAKRRPLPPSHASSSRLAALVDQIPVPNERETAANSKGGKHRPAGKVSARVSPSRLAAAVGNIPMLDDEPSQRDDSGVSRTVSDADDAEEARAETEEADKAWQRAAHAAGTRRSLRVQKKRKGGSLQRTSFAAPARNASVNSDNDEAPAGGEEDWAPSPAARDKRSLKGFWGGTKKRSGAADAKAAAARRAITGGRKRSEKLTDFTGVTLKNGRIAVMLWNPVAKKPIHLGYWPSSLAAARMADKARLASDFRKNVKDEDLNFPQAEYSPEELPASIADLADFIKEEQGAARKAESAQKAQDKGSGRKRPTNPSDRDVAARRVRFSHYLGVSWNKQSQQWQARFHRPDGSSHLLGGFDGEEEAGRAYDEYALEHHGNGAVRNFPPSTYTGKPSDDAEAYWRIKQHAANGDNWLSNHVPSSRSSRSHRRTAQGRPSTAGTATTASASEFTQRSESAPPPHRLPGGQEMTSPSTAGEGDEDFEDGM